MLETIRKDIREITTTFLNKKGQETLVFITDENDEDIDNSYCIPKMKEAAKQISKVTLNSNFDIIDNGNSKIEIKPIKEYFKKKTENEAEYTIVSSMYNIETDFYIQIPINVDNSIVGCAFIILKKNTNNKKFKLKTLESEYNSLYKEAIRQNYLITV